MGWTLTCGLSGLTAVAAAAQGDGAKQQALDAVRSSVVAQERTARVIEFEADCTITRGKAAASRRGGVLVKRLSGGPDDGIWPRIALLGPR